MRIQLTIYTLLFLLTSCHKSTDLTNVPKTVYTVSGSIFKTRDQDCMPPTSYPCPDPSYGYYLSNVEAIRVYFNEGFDSTSFSIPLKTDSTGHYLFKSDKNRFWFIYNNPNGIMIKDKKRGITYYKIHLIDFNILQKNEIHLNDTLPGIVAW